MKQSGGPATFPIRGGRAIDLRAVFPALDRLPVVLRILLENVLRCGGESEGAVRIFEDWLETGRSEAEIEFSPGRLLMHDTTCGPALVDIAGMRDAVAESGGDPRTLNPVAGDRRRTGRDGGDLGQPEFSRPRSSADRGRLPRVAGFLASPPLVVAYAIAGTSAVDILSDVLGHDHAGREVRLEDIWPSSAEIDATLRKAHNARDFTEAFRGASESRRWKELDAPTTARFPWDEASTYLRRPPFTSGVRKSRAGSYEAYPLLVLGDDITTDHISPAGPIDAASETGRYLVAHGEDARDLNVHSSRRGNFESMVRGLFTNKAVVNHLAERLPPGSTIHAPTGEVVPLHVAARRYAEAGESTVVLAGERYGQGSSRDWAAKGLALLGVRAVLASSFERIHRTNLIGMGIPPLRLPADLEAARLGIRPDDRIRVDADPHQLEGGKSVPVSVLRAGKVVCAFTAAAELKTDLELQQWKFGGVVPLILARSLDPAAIRSLVVSSPGRSGCLPV